MHCGRKSKKKSPTGHENMGLILNANISKFQGLLCLALVPVMITGKFLDLQAIPTLLNFNDGEFQCQSLGYEGLAVLSSPEL